MRKRGRERGRESGRRRREDKTNTMHTTYNALANFIASNNITNLVGLSGDAHMLAFDDGTTNQ